MMYLVSTFAAGAAAIELRNLAVDSTNNKIEFNGHGFADGDIVLSSAAIGGSGGTAAGKMYVVDGKTTNDFKLKTFKAADATGETAVTFSDATGGNATLSKYGAKKCKIASTAASNNKVTCAAAPNLALTDELRIYCTDTTGDKCKLDSTTNAKLANGKAVWPREVGATETAFTLSDAKPTDGTPGAVIAIASNGHADTNNKVWLLSKDTGSIFAAAPKTLTADGGVWTATTTYKVGSAAASATDMVGNCGNAACGVVDDMLYYYTAGSGTTGLTNSSVYAVNGGSPGYTFRLNKTKVHSGGNYLEEDTASPAKVTASGNGDTYQRISRADVLKGSTKSNNKINWKDTSNHSNYAENDAIIFWCSSTTAADCAYNITGGTSGSTFKIKGTPASGTATLKASTAKNGCTTGGSGADGCADVAITADSANQSMSKGYTLKKHADAAVVFPAAAAGSAARSFAMLGSAVAMATAFLLA